MTAVWPALLRSNLRMGFAIDELVGDMICGNCSWESPLKYMGELEGYCGRAARAGVT